MTLDQQRAYILQQLPELDATGLAEILTIIEQRTENLSWADLPPYIQQGLEQGLKDAAQGRTSPHEEVMLRVERDLED